MKVEKTRGIYSIIYSVRLYIYDRHSIDYLMFLSCGRLNDLDEDNRKLLAYFFQYYHNIVSLFKSNIVLY